MITDFFFIDTSSEDSTPSDNSSENNIPNNSSNTENSKKRKGILTRIFKSK